MRMFPPSPGQKRVLHYHTSVIESRLYLFKKQILLPSQIVIFRPSCVQKRVFTRSHVIHRKWPLSILIRAD